MSFKSKNIFYIVVYVIATITTVSCSSIDIDFEHNPSHGRTEDFVRIPNCSYRNVSVIYTAGYNNLSSVFDDDIKDIRSSNVPHNDRNVLLIFSHRVASRGNYVTPTSPTLTRILKDKYGNVICDTLLVLEKGTPSASKETLHRILAYAKENYPAESYGLLFSSHGTGWMPANFKFETSSIWSAKEYTVDDYGLRPIELPAVRSIGYQTVSGGSALEININEFADAIPMHLDYLIFDACLMGGVEVAYEMKDKCNNIIFSAAEILADGMDYKTLADYLINPTKPDLIGFTENYYNFYNHENRSQSERSGTIALINCDKLNILADTCRDIFDRYNYEISILENRHHDVQKFYTRNEHKCFYDLEDIVIKCGASDEDLARLNNALNECVTYCASTEKILGFVNVNNFCGLSMYLPMQKEKYLNDFYKTLKWNKATGLVK